MSNSTISEMGWMDIFGDNLQDILKEYGMSQRELARRMNVEPSTINSYINKTKMISTKNLINMSYVLNISIDELANFDYKIR